MLKIHLKNMHKKLFFFLDNFIFFIQGKWPEDKLRKTLEYLKLPAIKPGKSFIYKLWTALLHQWFSKSDHEVYVVTPFLDVKRMDEICSIFVKHSSTAYIEAFYVRKECFKGRYEGRYEEMKISDIIRKVMEKTEYKNQPTSSTIENKIFKKVRITTDKFFHGKLIACTNKNNAMVLVTSANFSYANLDCENYETVVYHEMTTARFLKRVIEPLQKITDCNQ